MNIESALPHSLWKSQLPLLTRDTFMVRIEVCKLDFKTLRVELRTYDDKFLTNHEASVMYKLQTQASLSSQFRKIHIHSMQVPTVLEENNNSTGHTLIFIKQSSLHPH